MAIIKCKNQGCIFEGSDGECNNEKFQSINKDVIYVSTTECIFFDDDEDEYDCNPIYYGDYDTLF